MKTTKKLANTKENRKPRGRHTKTDLVDAVLISTGSEGLPEDKRGGILDKPEELSLVPIEGAQRRSLAVQQLKSIIGGGETILSLGESDLLYAATLITQEAVLLNLYALGIDESTPKKDRISALKGCLGVVGEPKKHLHAHMHKHEGQASDRFEDLLDDIYQEERGTESGTVAALNAEIMDGNIVEKFNDHYSAYGAREIEDFEGKEKTLRTQKRRKREKDEED